MNDSQQQEYESLLDEEGIDLSSSGEIKNDVPLLNIDIICVDNNNKELQEVINETKTEENEELSSKVTEVKNEIPKLKDQVEASFTLKKNIFEQLSNLQKLFSSRYQEILTIIRNCKDGKKLTEALNSELKTLNTSNESFISLVEYCRKEEVKESDVIKYSIILNNVNNISNKFKEVADKIDCEVKDNNERIERNNNKEREMEAEDMEFSADVVTISSSTPQKEVKSREKALENDKAIFEYLLRRKKLEVVEKSLEGIDSDEKLKKFRSDCRKAVNTPINAISAVSKEHMENKLKTLTSLLRGESVTLGDKRFTAASHPLGVTYCMVLLAKKLVNQGEQFTQNKQDAPYPLASLASAILTGLPEFRPLLLAHFQRVCPYLVPVYWEREKDESDIEYNKRLGFLYSSNGECEEINKFLRRMSGVTRLYAAMMVTPQRISDKAKKRSLGVWDAWSWMAGIINKEPRVEVSATLMLDILEVTGKDMLKAYGRQFQKLLHILCKEYIPKLEEVTPLHNMGPVSRLKVFLESIIYTNDFPPNKGIIPPNFW